MLATIPSGPTIPSGIKSSRDGSVPNVILSPPLRRGSPPSSARLGCKLSEVASSLPMPRVPHRRRAGRSLHARPQRAARLSVSGCRNDSQDEVCERGITLLSVAMVQGRNREQKSHNGPARPTSKAPYEGKS